MVEVRSAHVVAVETVVKAKVIEAKVVGEDPEQVRSSKSSREQRDDEDCHHHLPKRAVHDRAAQE